MESFSSAIGCVCRRDLPPGWEKPFDCTACLQGVERLRAACEQEYEQGMEKVQAAKTPAEVEAQKEDLYRVAEVASRGDIAFDGRQERGRVLEDLVLVESIPEPHQVTADINDIQQGLVDKAKNAQVEDKKIEPDPSALEARNKSLGLAMDFLGGANIALGGKDSDGAVERTEAERTEAVRTEQAKKDMEAGNSEAAEKSVDQALASNPKNREAREVRALARMNQGKNEESLADVHELLRQDPKNQVALDMKTYIESSGRLAGKTLSLKRPDFGGHASREGLEAGLAAALPGAEGRSGPGTAEDAVQAGGRSYRGTLPLSQGQTQAQVLARGAAKKLKMGDLSAALLEATRSIRADKGHAPAWALRAAVANKLARYDAALADATEALKLEPDNVTALLERGLAQYGIANYAAALEDVSRALALEPMNALGYLYRGMIFEKLSRYSEALSDYETAARLDPTLRQLWVDAKARLSTGKETSVRRGISSETVAWLACAAALASAAGLAAALVVTRRRVRAEESPS